MASSPNHGPHGQGAQVQEHGIHDLDPQEQGLQEHGPRRRSMRIVLAKTRIMIRLANHPPLRRNGRGRSQRQRRLLQWGVQHGQQPDQQPEQLAGNQEHPNSDEELWANFPPVPIGFLGYGGEGDENENEGDENENGGEGDENEGDENENEGDENENEGDENEGDETLENIWDLDLIEDPATGNDEVLRDDENVPAGKDDADDLNRDQNAPVAAPVKQGGSRFEKGGSSSKESLNANADQDEVDAKVNRYLTAKARLVEAEARLTDAQSEMEASIKAFVNISKVLVRDEEVQNLLIQDGVQNVVHEG